MAGLLERQLLSRVFFYCDYETLRTVCQTSRLFYWLAKAILLQRNEFNWRRHLKVRMLQQATTNSWAGEELPGMGFGPFEQGKALQNQWSAGKADRDTPWESEDPADEAAGQDRPEWQGREEKAILAIEGAFKTAT